MKKYYRTGIVTIATVSKKKRSGFEFNEIYVQEASIKLDNVFYGCYKERYKYLILRDKLHYYTEFIENINKEVKNGRKNTSII